MTTASGRYKGFPVGYSNNFYPSDGHVRWLKVRKFGTHLVSAAFFCPRFDGSVVGVEKYQVELFLRALHNVTSTSSEFSHREAPSTSWHFGNNTYYIVSYQMAPGAHPHGRLGSFDKPAQLRILQHRIGAYDRTVCRIPCGDGRVIESCDGLLQCALDPISADDDVCIENLARREGDTRPALEGRVRLYVAYSGIEPDSHARSGVRETEEHSMVIPTVDLVVGRTVIFNHARTPTRVPDAGARIVSTENDRLWYHGDTCERLAKPPLV